MKSNEMDSFRTTIPLLRYYILAKAWKVGLKPLQVCEEMGQNPAQKRTVREPEG